MVMHQVTPDISRAVVGKLIELQAGRSEGEMAALLGCSRSHWSHLKKGHRRVSYPLLKRAMQHFPALYPIALADLTSELGAAS